MTTKHNWHGAFLKKAAIRATQSGPDFMVVADEFGANFGGTRAADFIHR